MVPTEAANGVRESHTRLALLAFAGLALNQAMRVEMGQFHPRAILWLTVALLAAWAALLVRPILLFENRGGRLVLQVLGGALAIYAVQAFRFGPGYLGDIADRILPPFRLAALLMFGLVVYGARAPERGRQLWFPLLALLYLITGVWFLRVSPPVGIDVLMFQNLAADGLLQGLNPYTRPYPDQYGAGSPFYGPGVVANGHLTVGLPYPPLSLYLCLPARWLFGDVRYAHLLALTLTGLFMGYLGPGRISRLAAAAFWLAPCTLFMAQMSWTEPFGLLFLSLFAWLATRTGGLPAKVFGLALASKQFMLLLPLTATLLLRHRERTYRWRFHLVALAVAAAVTLPFILWDWRGAYRSLIEFQLVQPFRQDALSYPALFASWGWPRPTMWLPFPLALLTIWAVHRRGATTMSGFFAGSALVYMVFFAMSKQAFCNYYFLAAGLLSLAVCTAEVRPPAPMYTSDE
jgi:hypothetical protein